MHIEKLTLDDIAICVNYICEEFESLGGDPKKISTKMTYSISDKTGYKVIYNDIIIGFAVVEDFGNSLLITSLVVNKEYRFTKAVWLLFSEIINTSGTRSLVYIPIHKNMIASKLCSNGIIDKDKAIEWINRMESKYGRK